VCKIVSIAEVSRGEIYENVYEKLRSSGRAYLDTCQLIIWMHIDGAEVKRELPGKYTAFTGGVGL